MLCYASSESSQSNESGARSSSSSEVATEELICRICLGFSDETLGPLVKAELCGHEFHQVCLRTWLLEHSRCPLCNKRQRRPEETAEEQSQRQASEAEAVRQRIVADSREAIQLAQRAAAEQVPDAEGAQQDEEGGNDDEEDALEFQRILFLSSQPQAQQPAGQEDEDEEDDEDSAGTGTTEEYAEDESDD